MGAVTVGGKGSRSRVKNRKAYDQNLKSIDFSTRKSAAVFVRRRGGKTVYVYARR